MAGRNSKRADVGWQELSPADIAARLAYDPATGQLVWREGTGIRSAALQASWNKAWAGKLAGSVKANGYRLIEIDGCTYRAHRLAWVISYGAWPINQIDHVNGCRDDNRLVNLRQATNSQNRANIPAQRNNALGAKGVCLSRDRYKAQIKKNGKSFYLGSFDTVDEASAAYSAAAMAAFGEFANAGR